MLKKAQAEITQNDNLIDIYFKQIKVYPLLTAEEEIALSKEIQKGNTDAVNKLVNSNLRLAAKIAGEFHIPGVPLLDLIQEANMGLIQAAKKFDYRKNAKFSTYAIWWIRQFIARFILNKRRMVRLPQKKEDDLRKIQLAYNKLSQSMMHQPLPQDIAKELGVSIKDVDSVINLTSETLPLEINVSDDENDKSFEIYEDYTYSPERNFMKQISRESTLKILEGLKERERRIINYRYQLNGCERYTLREISNKMNISAETVRQIELKALKKIRRHADELQDCVFAV